MPRCLPTKREAPSSRVSCARPSSNWPKNMQAAEHTMSSWDGAQLFYRAWIPDAPIQKALLLFHRGHEHSGRWSEFVQTLALDDVAIFAWDARGHGQSAGERGAADNFGTLVKDVDAFVRH